MSLRSRVTSITVRITFTIMTVIVCTVALTAYLNHAKFERSLNALAKSRFSFVLYDLKNTVEASMNLGLELNTLRNTQEVLEREKGQDPQIMSIDVMDQAGAVLFSTGADSVGAVAPAEWLRHLLLRSDSSWTVAESDAFVIGVPLLNNFDKVVGGVALRYSKTFYVQKSNQVLFELLRLTLLISGIAAVVAMIAYVVFLRGMRHSFLRMEGWLRRLLSGQAPEPMQLDPKNVLEERLVTYYGAVANALGLLRATSEQVERQESKV